MNEPRGAFERAAARDGVLIEYRLFASAVRRARSLGAPVLPRYVPGAADGCNGAEAALAIRHAAAERGPHAPRLTYLAAQVENLAAEVAGALEDHAASRRDRALQR